MPIGLVLADDHPVVLAGLEQLLSLERDLAVLARCADGEEALQAVRRHRPDVLILDLQMPKKDGLAVLLELRQEQLPAGVVVLTASLGAQEVLDAVRLGARGVVLKDMAPRLLVECIRTVHAGGKWLERGAVIQALDRLMAREAAGQGAAGLLTSRELEIVRMVARGLRNKEIARKLGITEGTVKIHLHHIICLSPGQRTWFSQWSWKHRHGGYRDGCCSGLRNDCSQNITSFRGALPGAVYSFVISVLVRSAPPR